MKFAQGAPIFSADFREVGRINRFIVHPNRKRLTHLVMQRGALLTTEYVLLLDLVDKSGSRGVLLCSPYDDLQDLPRFAETAYLPVDDFSHETAVAFAADELLNNRFIPKPHAIKQTHLNIPDGMLALKATARVTSADHQAVGQIDMLYVDPKTGYISHLVIAHGRFGRTRKRVPGFWCRFIAEDEVYIPVDKAALTTLLEDPTSPARVSM